ncbi:uncharacterized protein LOC131878014 isoform X2 [Tigriopus californicus]|uniref:uncharacterized protein LOC131878014 isoform X2 n=1 Tax=Tigriopus californicus TaxID=6832 RepID=UPI0027D9D852|nr:uncharacterized protein LOC131878014 isoform X2 [Tigriopus californicus]
MSTFVKEKKKFWEEKVQEERKKSLPERSPMGFSRQRIPAEFLDGFPSSNDMAYPVNNRGIATIVTQPKGEGRSMTLPGNKFSISFDDNLLGRKRISRGGTMDSSRDRSQFQSEERLIGGRDASIVLSVQKSQTSIMSSSSGGVRRPHHRLASVSCSQLPLGKADKGSQTKQSVLLESRAESCGKIESNHPNAASCINSSRTQPNNKDIQDESKLVSLSDLRSSSSAGTARTTATIGSQPLANPTINSSKANLTKDQERPLPVHILKQTIKAQVNQSEAINQTRPSPGIKNNRSSQSFVGPEKSDPNGLDKSLKLKTSPILETNLDEDNVNVGLAQRVPAPVGSTNSPPLLTSSAKLGPNDDLIVSPSESQVSTSSSLGPLARNDSFTRAIEEGTAKEPPKTTNPTSPVGSGGSSEGSLELDSDSTASWFEAGHIDSLDLDEFRSSLRRLSVLPEESEESEVPSSIASPVQTPEEDDKGVLLFTPTLSDPRRGSFKWNSSKSKPSSHSLDHHLDESNKSKGSKRLSRHISDPLVLSGTMGAAKGLTLPEEGTLDKLSLSMKLARSTSRPLVMTSNNSLQSNNTENTAVPCSPSELEDIEEIDKDAPSLPSSDDDEFKEFEEAFSSPKSPDALSSSIYESPLSSMMEYESPISSPSYYATPLGSSPWTSPQTSFKCPSPSSPSRKTMTITSSPFPEHQIPINVPDSFLNVPTLAVMSNCKRSQSLKVRPNGGLRPGRNLLQSSRAFDLGDGDVDDLPPSDISSSKPAQFGPPWASKNGASDPARVQVSSPESPFQAKAVLMRRACSVPSETHTNIGIPSLVHTQNPAQENVPERDQCAKPNEVQSPSIIPEKNPTNKNGFSSEGTTVPSKKPEDKPNRVPSSQPRAEGQENQKHFTPDGRTADIVKDEKGQEAAWPSSQIQGDCQSARKGSVRRSDKESQNEKNGDIQETKDEHGKVQRKQLQQTNQGQAAPLGDREIGNQLDKHEEDLGSEGGSEKTMSSLAGSSFQRSVAFDLTISDERHSSSSSSSSSSEDGEHGEHTREEQKVLEKVETPTKGGDIQVDPGHSLGNNGDYCVKIGINKSATIDDKSKLTPSEHEPKVLEEPVPDDDQTNMTNDECSTSLPTTPTKPKGILKPSSNSEALRNSSFPSLPETFLLKLGVNLIPSDLRSFSTDSLSDQDIESKFTALSLAFNTDKLTLNDRLELQQRQRDTAEKNIDEDIRQLKTAIGSLNKVCTDAETREMLHRLQKQVDVFRHSSERVSSSAEVYGAVQQEARISRAIEIMLHHVDNLKRIYEREHAELQDAKKILADNNLSIAASNSLLGAGGGLSGEAGPNNSSNKANSNRMRSISVINPSGTAVTFGPGTNGASSGSPKLRRASVGVPPASALRSPNPNRRNVVESGQLLPSFQKAIRKQATTVGPARKTSSSGGLRMYGAEGRESCFSTISEHGEVTSGGKFNDSFESRVAGQFAQNEGFRGDSNNNNNNNNHHVANGDILKKSDDFNAIPEYGARNRRSDRVRSTSLIEPVKEEEEDAILEEIDTLALKRDSSPAPHAFRRVRELPWLSYLRTLRQYFRHFMELYEEFTWPWDWDETILGVRYAITGVLLFAAFISLVFTFFGGGGSVKVTDAT